MKLPAELGQPACARACQLVLPALCALLAACAGAPPLPLSSHHLKADPPVRGEPPPLAQAVPLPPTPSAMPAAKVERYSVVVSKMPVQDILFVIARDAKLNIDVHPGVTGMVTMSALDQTLTEILDRVSRQADMRYEIDGSNLTVMPDSPFLRHYRVDYLNVARSSQGALTSSTAIASGGGSGGGSGGSGSGNSSSTGLTNTGNNSFWQTLVGNLRDLLRETDKILPGTDSESTGAAKAVAAPAVPGTTAGTQSPALPGGLKAVAGSGAAAGAAAAAQQVTFREAASVIANPEAGVVSVRATMKQHQKVREFIDKAMTSVRRQVLIEGTIIEVDLADEYQQGINWGLLSQSGNLNLQLGPQGGVLPSGVPIGGVFPSLLSLTGAKQGLGGGRFDLTAALRLLESFGRTRVLSSPKLSMLNNQPAVLRVVDNIVYFTVSGTYTPAVLGTPASVAVTSTPNTVSVGFTLGVTPQIGADDEVTLLLRPTISRVTGYVNDPGIAVFMALARGGNSSLPELTSQVPQVQTREMESVIRVRGGMTAVLGGLMRDTGNNDTDSVPGSDYLGPAGELLKYRHRKTSKSELVIFLRPVIVTDASLQGDYARWRETLDSATSPVAAAQSRGVAP
jgi:MSHA biogenesis protein MshL